MRLEFSISNWSAWAPGLTTQDAWREWAAAAPVAPRGADTPPLTEVPAMARRRVDKLGRPAFQVAQWCQGEAHGFPLIFASRHGDPGRGADLLISLAKIEPLSPASFALSVHNAIGAQYSIINADTANVSAISNGLFTAEAAVVEAVGLLHDGHDQVMIVVYDASPPALFASHYDEPPSDFAYALRITRGTTFSLESAELPASRSTVLPHGLSVLRFILGNEHAFTRSDGTAGWKWTRHV
ncbi:MAG: beta-ketoacyl synthase chain length factor [Archangium sp.]|nr:beta-ketoacyl synthase chain length factor [Archangium sp.]MDP3157556.1 beta-ketoacyl synthase chain length factor [Archangium sp.]MDP3571956.1 beta-ketoacyl synthase chain length factor [Archangium sp.]